MIDIVSMTYSLQTSTAYCIDNQTRRVHTGTW